MTIQEMIARQQAIVTQARNEGRGLSREEQTEFDQLQGRIDAARSAGGQDNGQNGGEPGAEGNRGAARWACIPQSISAAATPLTRCARRRWTS